MLINFNGEVEGLIWGVEQLKEILSIELSKEGFLIKVEKLDISSENALEINDCTIKYKSINDFFRALGIYFQLKISGKEMAWTEKKAIPNLGVMVDVSRNAVYRVNTIKELIRKLALMGYDRFMLYTEDTYTIEGYPYFGYMRGRYSREELTEIDDYAYGFGIEVIPCIQTLGHLREALKWECSMDIKDTEDVLLVGEDKTYELIESMISSMSKALRSKNIHIGMDEAFDLGRGQYLTKNGYIHHYDLMTKHLKRVCEITKKYGLKPMMWDDMFFRAAAPNSGYYDFEAKISEELAGSIPEELSLVYWDYYHTKESEYSKFFDIRKAFKNEIVFAGGAWKWMGFSPHYEKTIITTNAAMKQCKEKGIKHAFITAWGDDGAETPLKSIDLGLILFAEHGYAMELEEDWLQERCKFLTGLSIEDFKAMEELDLIPGVPRPNLSVRNPSKYLLYQDILLGAFDKHIENDELDDYYFQLEMKYNRLMNKSKAYAKLFEFYAKLSSVLSIKGDIGLRLRWAYLKLDNQELAKLKNKTLPELLVKLDAFHDVFREVWFETSKGQGFEVHDIRLGGVKERVKTTIARLEQFLEGSITNIEELEEDRLYFRVPAKDSKLITTNQYNRIATQNVLE